MTTAAPNPSRRRRIVLLVLLAGGLALLAYHFAPAGGPAPPSPDLTDVDPAVRVAVEQARAEVQKAPRDAGAWGRLGMVLSSHIFANEALACFARAERLDPEEPRWPYHHALIRLADDPPSALPKLGRAVALCRDSTDGPRLRLAELHVWMGETGTARAEFTHLLRLAPSHPRAHLGLARLEFQAGRYDDARKHLAPALAEPLTRKSALALSAELHQRLGDAKAARQDRARMVDSPDDPEWPDAYAVEAARLKVGESALLHLAGQLLDRNRPADAMALVDKVLRDYPRSGQGWTLHGWARLMQGDLPGAERSLRTAVDLEPRGARAWLYLGVTRFKQQDRREAAACFRKAVEAKPAYLQAHFNLGLALKEEGETEGAVGAFETAVRCEPLSAPAHAKLGELLLKLGRRETAASHLRQAVELNPADEASRKLLEGSTKGP